jgi:hypothetical protein
VLQDLAAPEARFDAATRSLRFTDAGGGVETVQLEVDGQANELHVGGERCHRPFVYVVPCAVDGAIALDDLGFAPGERSIFAVLTDAAGNRTYAGPFVVRAPTPPAASVPAPPPPAGIVILDGSLRRRAKYEAISITGIVRERDGFPIGRGAVGAATRVAGGDWRPLAATSTDANGRFKIAVPKGPSREVRVSYLGATQTVRIDVAAPLRLSTDRKRVRNGQTVRFRGHVAQAGTARTRVTLQAWARGKWMPFRTVALRNGRFSARYRFSGTYATARYRFRAVIRNDPGFVFAAGSSPAVEVVVRPKGGGR